MKLTPVEQTTFTYLHALGHDSGVTEVRILSAGVQGGRIVRLNGATVSGYYDPEYYEKLLVDIRSYNGIGNIYTCLNPAHPHLLARACNRLVHRPTATTGDDEIIRLSWLPIDVDPYRPSETSATDTELEAALKRRDEVVAFLISIMGDGHHITGVSGNGGHALFRIDLPNDAEGRTLLKEIGNGLARKFSDPHEQGRRSTIRPVSAWTPPSTTRRESGNCPARLPSKGIPCPT